MQTIEVNLTLYGPLASYANGKHIAAMKLSLESGSCLQDLLDHFGIRSEEKSYVFINAVLCDVPGLSASLGEVLRDGDRVGIFSRKHMWPYQYRDGIRMSEALTETLRKQGAMRNVY